LRLLSGNVFPVGKAGDKVNARNIAEKWREQAKDKGNQKNNSNGKSSYEYEQTPFIRRHLITLLVLIF
jgi:hypothetical protein